MDGLAPPRPVCAYTITTIHKHTHNTQKTDLLLPVLHVAEALQRQAQQRRAVGRGAAGLLGLHEVWLECKMDGRTGMYAYIYVHTLYIYTYICTYPEAQGRGAVHAVLEEEGVDGPQHLPRHVGEAVGARAPGLGGLFMYMVMVR
jgi:hypothetical protein